MRLRCGFKEENSMKILCGCCAFLCFLACWPYAGRMLASSEVESIEMQAVLFSDCVSSEQKVEPQDLHPVRVVYARIQKVSDKASIQYREFDETCKRAFIKSGEWTLEQFNDARIRLQRAGMRDGAMLALSESSGNDLPISFLKVRSAGLNADVYSLYLRFRWAGKMSTDDTIASMVLDEWRSLLEKATPEAGREAGEGEDISEIARDCARGWPPSLQPWVWMEARKVTPSEKPYQDCPAHPVGRP
jgi:hypothetical protein